MPPACSSQPGAYLYPPVSPEAVRTRILQAASGEVSQSSWRWHAGGFAAAERSRSLTSIVLEYAYAADRHRSVAPRPPLGSASREFQSPPPRGASLLAQRYRRLVPAMESEAISSMIRGGEVLRASSTPQHASEMRFCWHLSAEFHIRCRLVFESPRLQRNLESLFHSASPGSSACAGTQRAPETATSTACRLFSNQSLRLS